MSTLHPPRGAPGRRVDLEGHHGASRRGVETRPPAHPTVGERQARVTGAIQHEVLALLS